MLDGGVSASGDKVALSGDDCLIEYCERLRYALAQIPDHQIRPAQQAQLIRFISHFVWQMPDKVDHHLGQGKKGTRAGTKNTASYQTRIQNRIIEMKDRRKRLLRQQYKTSQSSTSNFAKEYTALIAEKRKTLAKLDSSSLEHALKESTKAAALELVLTLLPQASKHGILIDLEVGYGVKVDP